jgi:hypothetical protein
VRTLGLIALGSAVATNGGLSTSALAADRLVVAVPPLERANSIPMDKAIGIGPRFKFSSAPQELPPPVRSRFERASTKLSLSITPRRVLWRSSARRSLVRFSSGRAKLNAHPPV